MNRVELDSKLAAETKTYVFDFTGMVDSGVTLSSPSCTASVYSGTDSSPSSIVSGSASVSGTEVSQDLTAGVEGVIYTVLMEVDTSDGQTLQLAGYLAVVPSLV